MICRLETIKASRHVRKAQMKLRYLAKKSFRNFDHEARLFKATQNLCPLLHEESKVFENRPPLPTISFNNLALTKWLTDLTPVL
jgi:hypothetical protein